ncbi:MAG: hypothetical protein J6I85_02920 [Clostridia bacterium]|nr:hypothetical protein [Clostridia bacterium]
MFNINKIYADFAYPEAYYKILELNLTNFDYWYFIPDEDIEVRIEGMKKRYPNRKLVPFARRGDNDDVACFEIGKGETVQIIHDFASSGYEQREEYKNIWLWLKAAIKELEEKQ